MELLLRNASLTEARKGYLEKRICVQNGVETAWNCDHIGDIGGDGNLEGL